VSPRAGWARACGAALLAAAALAGVVAGCNKDKESLILVRLSTEGTPAVALASLTIQAMAQSAGQTETFVLEAPLSTSTAAPTVFGIYVGATGMVKVTVTARPAAGSCAGFLGSSSVNISTAGDTKPTQIALKPGNVCTATGAGGHAGSGQGGRGGSEPPCLGTAPPPGVPPSLTCCTTYDHGEVTADNCDDNNTYVYTAAFSPDGSLVMTGGDDGRVLFWSYDGQNLLPEGHYVTDADYGYAAFSPDGALVAIGGFQVIDVYYLTGTKAWTLASELTVDGIIYGVGFSPDSQRVLSLDSGGNLYVHNLTEAAPLYRTAVPVTSPFGLAVAPAVVGGVLGVAVLDEDGQTAVYGVSSQGIGSPTQIDTDTESIWAGCFSPDGTLLALGQVDSFTRFYNFPVTSTAPTGAEITIGNDDDVRGCAFSPNGSYIALVGGWQQGSASIWNVAQRTMTSRFNFLDSRVNGLSVGFAPAGNAIVVGGQGCGKVLLCRE
jgi:hypothetical protein